MPLTKTAAVLAAPLLIGSLAACATSGESEAGNVQRAIAPLFMADGTAVGTAIVTATPAGLRLDLEVRGISPGPHGVHVHTTGACTPTFAAAGGHWNPGGHTHGLSSATGQHAGDMPNVEVGADGRGRLTYMLGGGATFAGLMDADGSAFVVHAGPDDQVTDPAGNSGDRIACGIFSAG